MEVKEKVLSFKTGKAILICNICKENAAKEDRVCAACHWERVNQLMKEDRLERF